MFQSQLPEYLWSHAIKHSFFLINRIPSPVTNKQTPYELLHNHKPDFSMLKVFGSLCYSSTNRPHQKFDPRSRQGVFLGFQTGIKGYVILDFQSREIFISRNVIFYETIFPFIQNNQVPKEAQHDPLPMPTNAQNLHEENPIQMPNPDLTPTYTTQQPNFIPSPNRHLP